MTEHNQTPNRPAGTLAEDARAMMAATADLTGEKVGDARRRLASALERSKEVYEEVRDKTVQGVKAADATVHAHPYQAMGLAFGAGALAGLLVTLWWIRGRD
jgi:ElaB/YqjD/DUF883 family membrane-anchored ribosome-binding protein